MTASRCCSSTAGTPSIRTASSCSSRPSRPALGSRLASSAAACVAPSSARPLIEATAKSAAWRPRSSTSSPRVPRPTATASIASAASERSATAPSRGSTRCPWSRRDGACSTRWRPTSATDAANPSAAGGRSAPPRSTTATATATASLTTAGTPMEPARPTRRSRHEQGGCARRARGRARAYMRTSARSTACAGRSSSATRAAPSRRTTARATTVRTTSAPDTLAHPFFGAA
eukprot:4749230-Prymnesium_polylepis.2